LNVLHFMVQVLAVEVTRMLLPPEAPEEEAEGHKADGLTVDTPCVVLADELAAVLDPMLKVCAQYARMWTARTKLSIAMLKVFLPTTLKHKCVCLMPAPGID
jgi:hypothetical protein